MNNKNITTRKNIVFIFCIVLILIYSSGIIYGEEKGKSDDNIIVIDKKNNSVSIGNIDNGPNGVESGVKRETTINDMVIINNNDKVYIKHKSNNETVNQDEN